MEQLHANDFRSPHELIKTPELGLWVYDVETQNVRWSLGMYKIHDLDGETASEKLDEIAPLSLTCYAPEDRREIESLFERCISLGEPYDIHRWFTTLSGRKIRVRATAHALRENQKITTVVGCLMDIPRQKLFEETLQNEKLRYDILMDASRDGIAIINQDHKVVEANSRFAEMLGYPSEEVLNLHSWDFEVNMPEAQIRENFKDLTKTNTIFQTRHRRKDGTIYDAEVSAAGALVGNDPLVLTISRDITERNSLENQLKISETRNRQIIQTTRDGFFRTDLAGRILEVNEAYCRMSGYDSRELLCMEILDLDVSMTPDAFSAKMRHIIEKGNARLETRHRRKDGRICDIEVSVQPLEEDGRVQFVSFMRDITRRKSQENLQGAKLRLVDFAATHSAKEFLRKFLDEAELLTDSSIGFFHFLEGNAETVSLQTWSTNTLNNNCTAEGSSRHYPLREAGVWADCVKTRTPLIHNDYESLPHKKGMPAGHAPVVRELVVPIIRNEKIAAVLGVGNKPTDYAAHDIDTLQEFADLCWETVILKRAEEEQHKSEKKFRSIMESMTDSTYICSPDYRIEYMNPTMICQIGRDATGEPCYRAVHGRDDICPICCMDRVQRGETVAGDFQSPGNQHFYHVMNSPLLNPDGTISKIAIFRDMTHQKQMEEQLRQAQKLESIGNLAAGIAHDFNNILFPIMGLSELLMEDLPAGSFEREHAVGICSSAMRAADLVKQILTFSRRGETQRIPIRIQQVLRDVYKLMRTTIPSNIPLHQEIQKECRPVLADPTQLHQIGMNLITNAYHAVQENGGEITLTLQETMVEDDAPSLPPGAYAVLSVSDTGKGIPPDVLDRIFEPYFSTKAQGKGTGLGLSTVYGIVKEYGGDIRVANNPGRGVRFDVYLPVIQENAHPRESIADTSLPSGHERILIVDDEDAIITMAAKSLRRLGYQVTPFTSPLAAREAFSLTPGDYDLAITDMAMPHMTGIQLSEALLAIRPDVPIIICTGFSEKIDPAKAKVLGIKGVLMKPVGRADLAAMVRHVLDGAHPPPPDGRTGPPSGASGKQGIRPCDGFSIPFEG